MSSSPRLWMYSPNNSPTPLPGNPILFTQSEVIELNSPKMPIGDEIDLADLRKFIGDHQTNDGKKVSDLIDIENSRPLLIAGELANPYRLCDIDAPSMPIIPVRIENICRTWADNLDARDVNPGVHHVTVVRSPGWWELSYITLVEPKQMKRIVQWLDGSTPNTWAPKRLAEGVIRLENDYSIKSPSIDDISWDGVEEVVNTELPKPNGPKLDMSTIVVPINTKSGCYNSRGRVIRCQHFSQKEFHDNLFRRGSSFLWSDLLNVL
ncbi:MAG: hypothetical protein VW862_02030 [Euryarchaeota archaeon]